MITATATDRDFSDDPFEFLTANRDALTRVCLRWTRGHRADAADLLAAATLKVAEAQRENNAQILNPFGWWYRIIANLARDRHRSRRDALRLMPEDAAIEAATMDSHRVVSARQDIDRLSSKLTRLPGTQREALLLRTAGFEYLEIARKLEISPEYARKLVQLARVMLRGEPC
jgi:RNA polymerase sigma factor (sigma-70 family)